MRCSSGRSPRPSTRTRTATPTKSWSGWSSSTKSASGSGFRHRDARHFRRQCAPVLAHRSPGSVAPHHPGVAGRIAHVTSDQIIAGFSVKLADPDLIRRLPLLPAAGRDLLPSLRGQSTIVPLDAADIIAVTGDPEDDAMLATATLGRAAYLVTGDRGLLALGTYQGVRIITPRDFLAVIEPGTSEAG